MGDQGNEQATTRRRVAPGSVAEVARIGAEVISAVVAGEPGGPPLEGNGLPRTVSPGSVAEVARIGTELIAEATQGTQVLGWRVIAIEDVLLVGAMDEVISPSAAFGLVASYLSHLVDNGDYAEATVAKAASLNAQMVSFLERASDIGDVREIDQQDVVAWINAPRVGDELREAAERTRDNRRWSADLFFRVARSLNLYAGDPLLDTTRMRRPPAACRPLVGVEIEACRKHARNSLRDTLGPVRLALAEAMASTSEIPAVLVSDYDPESGCVWLNGTGRRLHGRWAKLLPAGVEAVERRIAALGSVASTSSLAYEGRGGPDRAEAATSTALRKILNRAGLRDDRRVRPSSIRAGAGRRLYDETRDLQEVAHRLGLRSLDGVRQVIGLPEPEPDEPPEHRRRR